MDFGFGKKIVSNAKEPRTDKCVVKIKKSKDGRTSSFEVSGSCSKEQLRAIQNGNSQMSGVETVDDNY